MTHRRNAISAVGPEPTLSEGDASEVAPDEVGKKFEAEAEVDQKILWAPGRLSRKAFERPALVGYELG